MSHVTDRVDEGKAMSVSDAIKVLQIDGKIDCRLCPLDNAVAVLGAILPHNLDAKVRATVVYVLDVLKMDSVRMVVPSGLNLGPSQSDPNHDSSQSKRKDKDTDALQWLVTCFTPSACPAPAGKKRSFKSTAKSVRNVMRLLGRRAAPDDAVRLDGADAAAVAAALAGADGWRWDVWRLRDASGGRPLQALGYHLLREWGLLADLKLDAAVVRRWLAFVEGLYLDNPYHNSTHAADVLQAVSPPPPAPRLSSFPPPPDNPLTRAAGPGP